MADAPAMAPINEVKKYFGMTMAEFKKEWQELSAESKQELRELVFVEIN